MTLFLSRNIYRTFLDDFFLWGQGSPVPPSNLRVDVHRDRVVSGSQVEVTAHFNINPIEVGYGIQESDFQLIFIMHVNILYYTM